MPDNFENPVVKYQWVKGENTGTVEQFKSAADGFIHFDSGRRINAELLNEFMVQVSADADILNIETPKVKTKKDIETETGLSFENSQKNDSAHKEETINPIVKLLEKQSKNNKIKISIEFDVNVPKKEVVSLLQDSFEEDVMQEVIKFSKSKLNKKEIVDKVYNQLEEHIKMYYS
jgi:vancomycin resistance protein YoaR